MKNIQTLAAGSIVIACIVFGLKYLAYAWTGSIALFSDALESVINVVTAFVALAAIKTSAKPADSNHPYGHHKAEYFSAVLEGVLIVVAALAILRAAYFGIMTPRPIDAPWEGMAVNALASVINAGWCWLLIRTGRAQRSPALVADGMHLFTDVLTSIGVLVGLLLAVLTGWAVLDPVLAALVALSILWSGWRLLKESVSGLMDEAPAPEILGRITALISANSQDAIEAHDLRARHAGRRTFIDFHLVVPGDMTVARAHEICDRIEQAMQADMGDTLITIHVEPDFKAKHSGMLAQ
ncbi:MULTISPECIES: cation diffusion facilitator family transporter [Rhodomicrobium]|uniref:cation diffusion facilitator family transporter n=1 Tax=Rhodomicrobium TaxID=1068 RepID=UPI000B4B8F34|nr:MULTISPECIES: cation diffusion facilitator family transporter [Rhodomicrobium]